MTKKTGEGLKKTREVAQKKKGRLFFVAAVLAAVALIIAF